MRLVKFPNGKYGIRYGWFQYEYLDFKNTAFKWNKSSDYFDDCMVDEDKARYVFYLLKTKDEVIA